MMFVVSKEIPNSINTYSSKDTTTDYMHYLVDKPKKIKRKYALIDSNGTLVTDYIFDNACIGSSEGLIGVAINNKWGYVNAKGDFVIYPQFEDASPFSHGLARVQINNMHGYINKLGSFIIKPQFKWALSFNNSGIAEVNYKGEDCFIDTNGKLFKSPPPVNEIIHFSEGLALNLDYESHLYGYIDEYGNEVIKPKYSVASDFYKGHAIVSIEGSERVLIINKRDEVVIETPFFGLGSSKDGIAEVRLHHEGAKYDGYIYINYLGEIIWPKGENLDELRLILDSLNNHHSSNHDKYYDEYYDEYYDNF